MNLHSDASLPENLLATRYASSEMATLFSPARKYSTWRKLWLALARAQQKLGLPISSAQIKELEAHVHSIDFKIVQHHEKNLRHDVMAHIAAYGDCCPQAKPIIHLGATSAFVTDNTDLLEMREAMRLLKSKLHNLLQTLSTLAETYADLPTLSYTHLQAAQPTTLGKRFCLWLQDFLLDLQELLERESTFRFLGLKGATGTQASFLSLFNGDKQKVQLLEKLVSEEMGFDKVWTITCQTYPRKEDQRLFQFLAGLATSAHKCATDLRLLSHMQEIDEPFGEKQIGSSAMPHKRNPMRCERICSLSRFLLSLCENPAYTAATQWLERTLDDSANRRLILPQAWMAADALLNLLNNVFSGLHIYPKAIERHLQRELPFLALESLLMAATKRGGDRQHIHEKLRAHSLAASQRIKEEGLPSDLLERLSKDASLGLTAEELQHCLNPRDFIGCAPDQVRRFLNEEVAPLLHSLGPLKPLATPVDF